jgi:hypothetical protein
VYVIRAGCNGSNSVLGNAHKSVIIAFHTCFKCSVVWECVVCCGVSVFRIQGKIRKGRQEGIRNDEVRCNGQKKRAIL